MANLTLTDYLSSAVALTFPGGAAQTLTSLADNEWTSLTDEITNSSDKNVFVNLEVVLGSAAFTGADSALEVYLVPTLDGTNYPGWTENSTSDAQQNVTYYVDSARTTGTTASQRVVLRGIELPPGKFKFGFRSRANVALASSGNTVSIRPYSFAT